MNRTEYIAAIAEETGLTKKAVEQVVASGMDVIEKALKKGDTVSFVGFGSFGTKKRPARKGLNPRTKEEIKIPAATVPFFKAGKGLKDSVNKKKKK